MELQRVKIINQTGEIFGMHCFVGDNEIHGVTSVDFKQSVEEVPTFTFETPGLPDIEMFGEVFFRFTPDTVQQAAAILQNEFQSNPESRKALISSISSVLKELPQETWSDDVSELIANRIIGIENK